MLEANFISGYETVTVQGLTQWDKGQKLKITGLATLPATFQVHFSNTTTVEAIVMMGSATGGVGTVDIPNSLLEDGLDIRAWIYVTDAEGSETIKTILMPVAERTKPADFISAPNPTEQTMLETTLNTVNTTMGMLGDPNGIATLDNLGKVNTSQLPSYVDDVIEGYYSGGKFYKESAHTTLITGETGKVYLDISVSPADSYRYGGSAYAKINNVGDSAANTVTFSEASTLVNIASGETHATMFGKIKKLFTDMIAVKNKFPITDASISNNAVTSAKIAPNSINSTHILDGSLVSGDLAQPEKLSVRTNAPTLVKKVVLIGDSYVHSDNGRSAFDVVMPTIATTWDISSFSDSGCAFTFPGAQGFKMIDLVINAANSLGSDVHNVDYVIFCGGRNEAGGIASTSRPSDSLESAAEAAFSNAHANFPNARVCFFPCLYDWRLPNSNLFKALEIMTLAASMQNVWVADGCWSWGIGTPSWYLYPSDIHPNLAGSTGMCKKIYAAVENKNPSCFRTRQDNVDSIAFYLNSSGIQIVGEHTFDGSSNVIMSNDNLPSWLQSRGGYNWYFAGYNPIANTTNATMVGLTQFGLAVAGGTAMPSGQKVSLCVNIPFTL